MPSHGPPQQKRPKPHGITSRPACELNLNALLNPAILSLTFICSADNNYKLPGPGPPLREDNSDHLARRDFAEANRQIGRLNLDHELLGLPIPITRHHNFPSHLPAQPPAPEDAPSIPPYQRPQSTPQPIQQSSGSSLGLSNDIIGPSPNPERNLSAIKRTDNTVPSIGAFLGQSSSAGPVTPNPELGRLLDRAIAQSAERAAAERAERAVAERVAAARTAAQRHNSFAQAQHTPQSRGFEVDQNIPNPRPRSRTYYQEDFQRGSITPGDRYRSSPPVHGHNPRHSSRSSQVSGDRTHTRDDRGTSGQGNRTRHLSSSSQGGGGRTPPRNDRGTSGQGDRTPDHSSSIQASGDRTPTRNDRGTSGQSNRTLHRRSSSQASSRSGEQPLRAGYPSLATQQDLTGDPAGFFFDPATTTRYSR